MASVLCIGGAAKYVAKDGSNVSDHWLVTDFVPHTAEKLGHRTAIVLGKALLFCLMDAAISLTIPVYLRNRLKERYELIKVLPEAVNPIDRIRIDVHQIGGKLHIDPVAIIAGGGVVAVGDAQAAILAQNQAIRARLEELFTLERNNNEALLQRFGTLQRITARYANQPTQVNSGFVQRQVVGGNEQPANENDRTTNRVQQNVYEGTLSKNPKDMYALWEEYEFGVEGRKPARSFSIRERGRNRYSYSRRKVVWKKVEALIRNGHTYISAIDLLYVKYGRHTPVTTIINRMRSEQNED